MRSAGSNAKTTMRLIVPYVGELEASDARLIRLAEFLGIECHSFPSLNQRCGGRETAVFPPHRGLDALLSIRVSNGRMEQRDNYVS